MFKPVEDGKRAFGTVIGSERSPQGPCVPFPSTEPHSEAFAALKFFPQACENYIE